MITNIGKSDAHNLMMKIEEKEDSGIYWRMSDIFPYSCLTPGATIKIHYALDSGYQKDPILKFEWDDDYGDKRTSKHSVFLG